MKNLLTLLSIALLSTTAIAETATIEFGAVLDPIKSEQTGFPEMVAEADPLNDSNLWEILDADKDGFISKSEAASSKQISDKWENLDSNKDDKLDTVEFSQIFTEQAN